MDAANTYSGYLFAAKLINTPDVAKWMHHLIVKEFWAMHRASRYHWNPEKRAARKPVSELFKHIRENLLTPPQPANE